MWGGWAVFGRGLVSAEFIMGTFFFFPSLPVPPIISETWLLRCPDLKGQQWSWLGRGCGGKGTKGGGAGSLQALMSGPSRVGGRVPLAVVSRTPSPGWPQRGWFSLTVAQWVASQALCLQGRLPQGTRLCRPLLWGRGRLTLGSEGRRR